MPKTVYYSKILDQKINILSSACGLLKVYVPVIKYVSLNVDQSIGITSGPSKNLSALKKHKLVEKRFTSFSSLCYAPRSPGVERFRRFFSVSCLRVKYAKIQMCKCISVAQMHKCGLSSSMHNTGNAYLHPDQTFDDVGLSLRLTPHSHLIKILLARCAFIHWNLQFFNLFHA